MIAGTPRNKLAWSRLDELTHQQDHQVRRLRRRVEETTDPDKLAMLLARLVKTRAFLNRLRDEQRLLV